MFHSKVIGTPSRNLDTFFTDEPTTRYLFAKTAKNAGISVLEGVMGIYDGLGGISVKASSYDLARVTDTPVILIVNARGMSLSVIPLIQGYLNYQELSFERETLRGRRQTGKIRGVILNQTTKMTYFLLKEEIEKQTGVRVYGYVPRLDDAAVESRHLGLVTPGEIAGLKERLTRLAAELEKCLDMDGILALAQEAEDYEDDALELPQSVRMPPGKKKWMPEAAGRPPRIAVAQDKAFCFYYQDNLDLLETLGAELVPFSPLHDALLPEQVSGLILGGGYPELYAEQLSGNESMRTSIRESIEGGLPYLAECGGFMYLHETMEDMDGREWPMCGCICGKSYRTQKLGRFGYIELEVNCDNPDSNDARRQTSVINPSGAAASNELQNVQTEQQREKMDSQTSGFGSKSDQKGPQTDRKDMHMAGFLPPGETIRAHEFHYFESTDPGDSYTARKPTGSRSWSCMHVTGHSAAGYPHLYYWSNPGFALRFLEKTVEYRLSIHENA